MNVQPNKTQELLKILDSLENCYNPNSPDYKFSHVFYSIVDFPVERPENFPIDLWAKYFIPETSLMPVILNRAQIEERKEMQNDLILKLTESKSGILKKLDALKVKKELVKDKLEKVVGIFRARTKKFVDCDRNINLGKIQTEILERERFVVSNNKEELLEYLEKMNERLLNFEKRVNDCVHMAEKKSSLARQINR